MNGQTNVWLMASAVSVVLLGFVFWQLDTAVLSTLFFQLRVELVAGLFVFLTIEAMITAKRIQYFTNTGASYSRGLYANAWYIMWLNLLPARLGEVAAISVFQRVFAVSPGAAIASIVTQRIFDLVVLTSLLIALLSISVLGSATSLVVNLALITGIFLLLATMNMWLDFACRILYRVKHKHHLLRKLLSMFLQGRRWYKHDFSQLKVWHVLIQTFIKWLASILAVAILLMACQLELPYERLLLVGILTNFLGAVPLQSVGGFGVMEAGLSGILYSFGVDLPEAIAVSLLLRLSVLSYTLMYFLFCASLFRET